MFRVIAHLDMDAFFASVEQRDQPALRGQPVIVGAPPNQRGVVCAASYEARKFGVRSAMPSTTAGRLCPEGVFVRPRMERYKEESREIMKLVAATGAVIEQMSIDEAYLDLWVQCQGEDADAPLLKALVVAQPLKQRSHSSKIVTASSTTPASTNCRAVMRMRTSLRSQSPSVGASASASSSSLCFQTIAVCGAARAGTGAGAAALAVMAGALVTVS